jgi:predicted MPP superfamily phosphohydrolase
MLLAVTVLGPVAFIYGRFIEPRWVEISIVPIHSSKIRPGSDPVRIVHVSDLHSPTNLPLQNRLPQIVAGLQPDVIVFTGDASNNYDGLMLFRDTLTRLARLAPTYAVRGNRDMLVPEQIEIFGGTGAQEMHGQAAAMSLQGVSLAFVGVSLARDWPSAYTTLHSLPDGTFVVFLGHSPDDAPNVARWGPDLYLAGHTHGGQIALPFYGALWTNSRYGKRFERGLHRLGDMWLYVNRGIGVEGSFVKIRFMARPEVTVIELHPEVDDGG